MQARLGKCKSRDEIEQMGWKYLLLLPSNGSWVITLVSQRLSQRLTIKPKQRKIRLRVFVPFTHKLNVSGVFKTGAFKMKTGEWIPGARQ